MTIALIIQRVPRRLSTALLLSLVVHALLLSMTLGGQSFGLPGLNFPWKERRLGANDLRIQLAPALPPASAPTPTPAPRAASPTKAPTAAPGAIGKPAVASNVTPMTTPPPALARSEAAAIFIPQPKPAPTPSPLPSTSEAKPPEVNLPIARDAQPVRAPATADARNIPAQVREVPVRSNANEAAEKQLEQAARERALEQVRLNQEKQSAENLRQAELIANAQRESARQEQLRQDAARAEQAAKSEAARLEAERQEQARQEVLRREALRQEHAKQDAARQDLERAEGARLEATRRETARQEATKQAQLEAARQAQAQLDAARQEAARQEAARRDAIKQEAARQDAAKQDAARQEQAKLQLVQPERAEQEAKREERLRAIGQQLNAETAQRDAALNRPSPTQQPTASSLRRGRLFGRTDPNADIVLYAEAMSRKIEGNMTFDIVREAVKHPHARPVVTVAIRADGSVEKVTFETSSGVGAIDEAIRKVVASQTPYGAFPPALARQYDVIEIRRTWIFDMAIRLQ